MSWENAEMLISRKISTLWQFETVTIKNGEQINNTEESHWWTSTVEVM